jgi:hypothetical protein
MVCNNTSIKPTHHSKDCPILKKIGLKLVKRTPANGGVQHLELAKQHPLQPRQPLHPQLQILRPIVRGLPQDPGPSWPLLSRKAMIWAKNSTTRESMRERCTPLVALTLTPHVSADNTSPDFHFAPTTCRHSMSINASGVRTIKLPKHILALLNNPPAHSIAFISNKLQPCTSSGCQHRSNGSHDSRQIGLHILPPRLWPPHPHGEQLLCPNP